MGRRGAVQGARARASLEEEERREGGGREPARGISVGPAAPGGLARRAPAHVSAHLAPRLAAPAWQGPAVPVHAVWRG